MCKLILRRMFLPVQMDLNGCVQLCMHASKLETFVCCVLYCIVLCICIYVQMYLKTYLYCFPVVS